MNEKEEKMEPTEQYTSNEITIGKWLNRGWDIVTSDLGNFVLLTLIYIIFLIALSFTVIGQLLLSGPFTAGYFMIVFSKLRGKPFDIGDISKAFNADVLIASILAGILVSTFITIGFFFLIIPGIILWAIYMFTFPLIVEQKLNFWEAMETSRRIVSRNLFEFSIFAFVQLLLLLVGFLLIGAGLLFTIPLVMVATACAYEDIFGLASN